MRCRNCGRELYEGDKFCPNCAEPVEIEIEDCYKPTSRERWLCKVWGRYIILNLCMFMLVFIWIIVAIVKEQSIIAPLIIWGVVAIVGGDICWSLSGDKRKENINNQFMDDPTSVCPKCGCHEIKLYRQGYDWGHAFWGDFLDIKGSRYTAGMNSNNLRARCMNCGKDWDTGLDSRLR